MVCLHFSPHLYSIPSSFPDLSPSQVAISRNSDYLFRRKLFFIRYTISALVERIDDEYSLWWKFSFQREWDLVEESADKSLGGLPR